MKTRTLHRRTQGFTLIEILTVITIIGLLAALGFGGYSVALTKSATKNTFARLAGLKLGIEAYKIDNGEYPEALAQQDTTDIKGASFNVGGARMLYQIMTGDGNNGIKGGGTASTGVPGSTGMIYWPEVVPPSQKEIEDKKKKSMVDVAGDGSFFIVDGWRKPFQYVKALKDRNRRISNLDLVHSDADYEIWSYGKLETPADDPVSQQEWITSWGTN
jgi:prepilin-type N-terminal cleavage/methylation domain-containing protein